MDNWIWSRSIIEGRCPPWPCPKCWRGTLSLRNGSLNCIEHADSRRWRREDGWEPDFVSYIFTAWAECGNSDCSHEFAISGIGEDRPPVQEDEEPGYKTALYIRGISPPLEMFKISNACPQPMADAIRSAFQIFWIDGAACAGRLRVALESLMDSNQIPILRKEGGKAPMPLDNRLKIFADKEPAMKDHLMALKWLGNTGSHSHGVPEHELLQAFEVLEHVIEELIDKKSARIAKIADQIDKRHNPHHGKTN